MTNDEHRRPPKLWKGAPQPSHQGGDRRSPPRSEAEPTPKETWECPETSAGEHGSLAEHSPGGRRKPIRQ